MRSDLARVLAIGVGHAHVTGVRAAKAGAGAASPSHADLGTLDQLSQADPSSELVDRVRRQAYAELASSRGAWRWIALGWSRVALPVALALITVGYLRWAIESASAMYR